MNGAQVRWGVHCCRYCGLRGPDSFRCAAYSGAGLAGVSFEGDVGGLELVEHVVPRSFRCVTRVIHTWVQCRFRRFGGFGVLFQGGNNLVGEKAAGVLWFRSWRWVIRPLGRVGSDWCCLGGRDGKVVRPSGLLDVPAGGLLASLARCNQCLHARAQFV